MIVDDFGKSPRLERLSNSTSEESSPVLNVNISDGLPAYSASSSLEFSAARREDLVDLFESVLVFLTLWKPC